jgi:hypothetical protein
MEEREMKELGTIEEEAAACRAAFVGVEVGAPVWCCHHEMLYERLTDPAEDRIKFILYNKEAGEQARRLREFRPVRDVEKYDAYQASRKPLDAEMSALHLAECPDTAWNGKSIFA